MPNLFLDLPLPVLNGPGPAVDTSGMGSPKTLTVNGSFSGATITVEASVDGGVEFAPVVTFQDGDNARTVIEVCAQFMRTRVSGRKNSVPFAANVDVGAPAEESLFALVPLPAGNGVGASVNVAAFGALCTFITGGSFAGAVILVEISEDGIDFVPLVQFAARGGLATRIVTQAFVRARVSGRSAPVPFTGSLALGACSQAGTGGGLQSFRYTVTGLEPDRSDFVVLLPAAEANDNYQVIATLAGAAAIVGLDLPDLVAGDRTITQFRVIATAPMTVGDQIDFIVAS